MTPALLRRREEAIDDALAHWDIESAERLSADYLAESAGNRLDATVRDRSPRFRAAFIAAQVALLAARPARAAELLAPLLPVSGSAAVDPGAQVRLLLGEALARSGRANEARSLVQEVPAARLAVDLGQRLRSLRVRLRVGDAVSPDELAACAAALARAGEWENEALLWCDAGRACEARGDLDGAEALWRRAAAPREASIQPARADALTQLARLDLLRGRLGAALHRYEEARRLGLPFQAREALLRRVLVLLELDRRAAAESEAAELLADGVNALPDEVRPLGALVEALLSGQAHEGLSLEAQAYLSGEGEEALSLYAGALKGEPVAHRRARLCLALGLLAPAPAESESWLREAERIGRERGMPDVLGRTLLARGRHAAGDPLREDEAHALFDEVVVLAETQASEVGPLLGASFRHQRHSALRHLLEAACRRGDAAAVFRYQERERGRLLLEWLAGGANREVTPLFARPEWQSLGAELRACEGSLRAPNADARAGLRRRGEELLVARDRLFERHLLEREGPVGDVLPPLPEVGELAKSLDEGALFVAPVVTRDGVSLLGVTSRGGCHLVHAPGDADEVSAASEALREELAAQLEEYGRGQPLGAAARAALDARLDELGRTALGRALAQLLDEQKPRRLVWAPDTPLRGVPVQALRLGGRYLIEMVEVVWGLSGALVVRQRQTRRETRGRWRAALALGESAAELPAAAREAAGVAAAFLRGRAPDGPSIDRAALRRLLAGARVVHFACHAELDEDRPLAACLRLPSKEALYALEWLEEPVRGLALVTLSACRSAQTVPLAGEAFGLVTGLLGGGARAVLAGLWPVADAEAPPLMWSFYRHLMSAPSATALARAQREALSGTPLFWAAFALFGDGEAVAAARAPWRWLAGWRQRRHAARFPGP